MASNSHACLRFATGRQPMLKLSDVERLPSWTPPRPCRSSAATVSYRRLPPACSPTARSGLALFIGFVPRHSGRFSIRPTSRAAGTSAAGGAEAFVEGRGRQDAAAPLARAEPRLPGSVAGAKAASRCPACDVRRRLRLSRHAPSRCIAWTTAASGRRIPPRPNPCPSRSRRALGDKSRFAAELTDAAAGNRATPGRPRILGLAVWPASLAAAPAANVAHVQPAAVAPVPAAWLRKPVRFGRV